MVDVVNDDDAVTVSKQREMCGDVYLVRFGNGSLLGVSLEGRSIGYWRDAAAFDRFALADQVFLLDEV